ncbi:MAG: hypothetical protein SFT81_07970 [Candidatus Caenarcaniphilales bacterium]|nr:hypothetical protein [Candidatus Caenarcaniphilales bacterium]
MSKINHFKKNPLIYTFLLFSLCVIGVGNLAESVTKTITFSQRYLTPFFNSYIQPCLIQNKVFLETRQIHKALMVGVLIAPYCDLVHYREMIAKVEVSPKEPDKKPFSFPFGKNSQKSDKSSSDSDESQIPISTKNTKTGSESSSSPNPHQQVNATPSRHQTVIDRIKQFWQSRHQ